MQRADKLRESYWRRPTLMLAHSPIRSPPQAHRMSLAACFGLFLLSVLATEVEPGKKFLLLKGLYEGTRYPAVSIPERRREMVKQFAEARLAAYTRLARLLHRLNLHFSTIVKRARTGAIRKKEIFRRERPLRVRPIQRFQSNQIHRFQPNKNAVLRDPTSSTDALGWDSPPIVNSQTIHIGNQTEPGLTEQPSPVDKKHKGSQEHLVLEADLLEDLVFNDIALEDVTVSQFDLRRRQVFNDVELEDFVFNEERIPSAISSAPSIPPLG